MRREQGLLQWALEIYLELLGCGRLYMGRTWEWTEPTSATSGVDERVLESYGEKFGCENPGTVVGRKIMYGRLRSTRKLWSSFIVSKYIFNIECKDSVQYVLNFSASFHNFIILFDFQSVIEGNPLQRQDRKLGRYAMSQNHLEHPTGFSSWSILWDR